MSKLTPLASGTIAGADSITVMLVEPTDKPTTIVVRWPATPTVCGPSQLDALLPQQ